MARLYTKDETPLWASLGLYVRVVKLLLSRSDVNPDKPDENGRTPLWWASDSGRGAVAELLLAKNNVSPDRSDNYGQAPLLRACFCGSEEVVRLLLERHDVNPSKPDYRGQTPLSLASSGYGYPSKDGIVRLLLERTSESSRLVTAVEPAFSPYPYDLGTKPDWYPSP